MPAVRVLPSRWSAVACATFLLCLVAAHTSIRAVADDLRLPGPTYRDAVALTRAGNPAAALAALERAVAGPVDAWPVEALLLEATLLEQSQRWMDAEPLWRAIGVREPLLAEFAGRALVGNYCARPAPDEALRALTAVEDLTGRVHPDLRADVGDSYARAGRDTDAIAAYRRASSDGASGDVPDRVRLALAAALERTGDIPAALDAWRSACLWHRNGSTYAAATERERRLARRAGGEPAPLLSTQYAALTDTLREGSRFADAVALYEEWRAQPGADREAIDAAIVDTLFDLRTNEDGVARAEAFVRAYPDSPRVPHIHVVRFRLAVRMGRVEEARALGLALWSGRIPGTSSTERQSVASLLAAFLVAVGRVDDGLDVYQSLYRVTRGSSNRMSVLWRAGVAAVRAGELDRAAANFRGALALKPRSDTLPASKYWLAHIDDQRGRRQSARATWRELAEQYPYDYYGERSVARLAAAGVEAPAVPARAFPELSMDTAAQHPYFIAAPLLAAPRQPHAPQHNAQSQLTKPPPDEPHALFAARVCERRRQITPSACAPHAAAMPPSRSSPRARPPTRASSVRPSASR